MKGWALEELAVSVLESGLWPQEALMLVNAPIGGVQRLVVVEGDRRLAGLKYLQGARAGEAGSKRWSERFTGVGDSKLDQLAKTPYLFADRWTSKQL
jgi:hypothetical protein